MSEEVIEVTSRWSLLQQLILYFEHLKDLIFVIRWFKTWLFLISVFLSFWTAGVIRPSDPFPHRTACEMDI